MSMVSAPLVPPSAPGCASSGTRRNAMGATRSAAAAAGAATRAAAPLAGRQSRQAKGLPSREPWTPGHAVAARRRGAVAVSSTSVNGSSSGGSSKDDDSQDNWAASAIPSYLYSPTSHCGQFHDWLRDASQMSSDGSPMSNEELREMLKRNPVWLAIRTEAARDAQAEPILSSFLWASILSHDSFERSLAFVLANRLADATMIPTELFDIFYTTLKDSPNTISASLDDCQACMERDPACTGYSNALLYYKGYHAIQAQRIAHRLWNGGRKVLALALQSRVSEVLSVDIHPATRLGRGILLDHGTGIVIGETAVVGDDCSLLQGVTLGGTGKESGDRHPKVGSGVLIGANATVLGNIPIGNGAQIAAGSLVLKPVPERGIVAGSPAKLVGTVPGTVPPACVMEHWVKDLDQDPYDTAPSKPSIAAAAVVKVEKRKKDKKATGGSSKATSSSPSSSTASENNKDIVEMSSSSALGEPPQQIRKKQQEKKEEKEEAPGADTTSSSNEQIDAKIAGLKLAAMSEAALLSADHSVELLDGDLPSLQIREGSSGSSPAASFDGADRNPPTSPSSAATDEHKKKNKKEPLSTAPWSESSQGDIRAASAEAAERLLQTLQPKKARPSSISRSRDVTKTMTQYSPSSRRGRGGSTGVGTIHQERPKPQGPSSGEFSGDLDDDSIEYNL